MTCKFEAEEGLIVGPTRLRGPAADTVARLALDTGATRSLVASAILVAIGYDPAAEPQRVRVTTGSGVEFVASLLVETVEALGIIHSEFPVLGHTLPPTAGVDGLLGLDFLRGRRLAIDFRTGSLTLE